MLCRKEIEINYKANKNKQRNNKCYEVGDNIRKRIYVFGNIHLFDNGCAVVDGAHGSLCCLREKLINQSAAKKVNGIAGSIASVRTENSAENGNENNRCHQRLQKSPENAENRVAVLQLYVFADYFIKQESVFMEIFQIFHHI